MGLRKSASWWAAVFIPCTFGCGAGAGIFNPAFLNTFVGGQFPLTPGPEAAFVFVRVLNQTAENAEFVVTIEKAAIERDEEGNPLIDSATGTVITRPQRKTVRLQTFAEAPANEMGVLFSCKEEPINIVGLGENLLPTDSAMCLRGDGGVADPCFGVPAASVFPLKRSDGKFACGDTIIFRAIRSTGVTGGVLIQSFLLPGFEQPSDYSGPNTFANLDAFLESQTRGDE